MATYRCIRCGTENSYEQGICECVHCKSPIAIPLLENDNTREIYGDASECLAKQEFDQAIGLFRHTLNDVPNDPVVNWMLLLCTYGIVYCKGENADEWKPTMWRYQPTRIMDNEYYLQAIKSKDPTLKDIFEKEAVELEAIRAGIEEKTSKDMPVDVFISYKDTDDSTKIKTHDFIYAKTLYNRLKRDGYRVFYAPITLKDEAGYRFEPYIYSALHSAKTMIVIGTKPEYFNAPWVRNEWERFLSLMKEGKEKRLISLLAGMGKKDLPDGLRSYQGINIEVVEDWESMVSEIVGKTVDVKKLFEQKPILQLVSILLSKGNFKTASEKCEKAWENFPTDPMVYLARLMIKLQVRHVNQLVECEEPLDQYEDYQDACNYGEKNGVKEMLEEYNSRIIERNKYNKKKEIYDQAVQVMDKADSEESYQYAIDIFRGIEDFENFEDTKVLIEECIYRSALTHMQENTLSGYRRAIELFQDILVKEDKRDAEEKIEECKRRLAELTEKTYRDAMELMHQDTESTYSQAYESFQSIPGYLESDRLAKYCDQMIKNTHKDEVVEASIKDIGEGNYQQAIDKLTKIEAWKNSSCLMEIAREMIRKDRMIELLRPKVGSIIKFGTYPQGANGEEAPIEWIVLDRQGDELLLISKCGLNCQPYNKEYEEVTWEECTLREWLDKEFYETAFSEEERLRIRETSNENKDNPEWGTTGGDPTTDRVLLLSLEEAGKYFGGNAERKCFPSAYARKNGAYVNDDLKTCRWWLRSPGRDSNFAAVVGHDGDVSAFGFGVNGDNVGVRPALWLILNP